ncbi:hypothetical protein GOBAR_AA22931 [Gossypium barbadense]|uniref:Uncharacterized protein n=1 Tax=Gossypium barbadense TaxID=3634 RepID=A0A2P5X311_GOSBA|nr:hypothetical protein GOBAR_AA22931 [Gossypium barbadense]
MVLKFGIWAWGPYVREENLQQDFSHVEHVVDLLWLCFQPTSFSFKTEIKNFKIPSAMELQQAGVKLRPGSSKNLFDIRFNNGVLEIPQLLVMDRTKVIFKNLMAYEQHYCSRNYVTDYVTLISFLVKSPRDAQLLIKNGIIENFLKDSEEVSTLFKGLVEEVRVSRKNFELARVVEDMRAYCKSRWHRWNATLKQDYFNSPWRSLSIIAATLLLLLTLVQTVCAIPSAMELQQAGVKLRPGSSKNLFDIRFNNGVLEIPQLLVMDRTKVIFKNLMAYEQHYCSRNYVTDYVTLISFLVKSPRDAQLLIKNGIIENFLKDSEEVSTLFKGLVEEVRVSRKNFELARVVEDMRAYCKSRWHRWNATLKQDYFNSPWRSLSIIAATLLLLLTLVQTVCAVIQVI